MLSKLLFYKHVLAKLVINDSDLLLWLITKINIKSKLNYYLILKCDHQGKAQTKNKIYYQENYP